MTDRTLTQALKIIVVLATLVVCEMVALVWFWQRPQVESPTWPSVFFEFSSERNIVQENFPDVDFSKVYPGMNDTDIDLLQRECFGIRYIYSPFVQFKPVPVTKKFVEITRNGYRKGIDDQPWPPLDEDLVVFVFGGSTTLGYGLANQHTVVSALQTELRRIAPKKNVQCYNFGRGYYFSTQERLLFESLLMEDIVPDIVMFIDGLNDFYYSGGSPELTALLYRFTAPDLSPLKPVRSDTEEQKLVAVDNVIGRYRHNAKIVEALTKRYGIELILVGQPVPFLEYERNSGTYPFPSSFAGHELCSWGYSHFREAAMKQNFGDRFLWCGDAFQGATEIMYADSIHYSQAGSSALARVIVDRAHERGLLPFFPDASP